MFLLKFGLKWTEITKLAGLKERVWTGGKDAYFTKDKLLELLYIEYVNNNNQALRFTDIKKNKNIPSWTTIKKRIQFETLEELWEMVLEHNNTKKDY